LASPETPSPSPARAPAPFVTARLSDLVSSLIPSPSPSRPVRWTAPVVQSVSRDRGPADEDDELFEIILTLAEEL
jgi:hypothetical protein